MRYNTAVIVLGMHRSGTSALAGMLSMLSVQFGDSLMAPQADNSKGFWEHQDIVGLNDRILAAFDSSRDDVRPIPGQSATRVPRDRDGPPRGPARPDQAVSADSAVSAASYPM